MAFKYFIFMVSALFFVMGVALTSAQAAEDTAVHSAFGTYQAAGSHGGFNDPSIDPFDPATLANIAPAAGEEEAPLTAQEEILENSEESLPEEIEEMTDL